MALLVAVTTAIAGVAAAVGAARLVLGGVLKLAFSRARLMVRRLRDRRQVERPGSDRRQRDRRGG